MNKLFTIVMTTVVALATAATPTSAKNPAATSKGFVTPAPATTATKQDAKSAKLGKDRHGMPFYHAGQTVRYVRATAYTHSESDHVGYGPRSAAGSYLKYTETVRSAAADWSVYPLGTKFKIKGQPYTYIVDDYGSALVGTGTIDIYHPTRALMNQWATRRVEIEVIEWGSMVRSMQKLSGRRGYKHCRRMYVSLEAQLKAAGNRG